ncbi:hypothetical protein JWS13_05240 (plasmid) [Rhodococcus pseudokoreensis]|uniref:Uncharacterized protein n=1 Tax=Rhodococcus pseudokoreensis TaxID=2811421 RepID=A0A974ZRT1_9NOCA|nr:hypothetical protein [Rhodococcus pseudokoreensis]QSE88061.1 hypothetical protein JWS13_05240 [Rhodococcus pseudokoreensis]
MSTSQTKAKARPRRSPTRQQRTAQVSKNSDSVRERLRTGTTSVVVDTAGSEIDLDDRTFAKARTDEWTIRIIGTSLVRIHLDTPLPETAQIVATDAARLQITGHVRLYAYTNTIVDAFDHCGVIARNHATINACDNAQVNATDSTFVNAYDNAVVYAEGDAVVHAGGNTHLVLSENARATTQRGVTVHGPSRKNVSVRR